MQETMATLLLLDAARLPLTETDHKQKYDILLEDKFPPCFPFS